MRILVLIAIGLLLYVIINNLLRKKRSSSSIVASKKMVQCKYCGLHVLEQEAVQTDDTYYCSTEHLDSDRQAK